MAAKLVRLKELEAKEEAAKQQSLQQLPTNNFSFPSQYSGFLYSQPKAVERSNLNYNYSQQFDPRLMALQYSNYAQQNNPYTQGVSNYNYPDNYMNQSQPPASPAHSTSSRGQYPSS